MKRRFKQVDVFGARPFLGNPVAVILDGQGLSDAAMASIATWTNLSETTFLLPPERGGDYRLRIFTPKEELPFAGHPTLGSAHAFLEAAGKTQVGRLVQECGAGLVPVVVTSEPDRLGRMLSFEAPAVSATQVPATAARELLRALGAAVPARPGALVIDVGPRWCVLDLVDGETVSRLAPDMALLADLSRKFSFTGVTVFGRCDGREPLLRVRSFAPGAGVPEDPACGSGNVCVAAFLAKTSRLREIGTRYTAVQGQEMGRDARLEVSVTPDGSRIDIGGRAITLIDGSIEV
jgi:PhzF family phenazine biosynthesis protein